MFNIIFGTFNSSRSKAVTHKFWGGGVYALVNT